MEPTRIRQILIFVVLTLGGIYIFVDFTVLIDLFRQSTIPIALLPYWPPNHWHDARQSALFHFSLRIGLGIIGLILTIIMIRRHHMGGLYYLLESLIPHTAEPVKVAAFWAWWTLLGYLLDLVGLNLGGWQLERSFDLRPFWEIAAIVTWEVTLALLFWFLMKKLNRPLSGMLIFALVGTTAWLAYNEYEVRHFDAATKLTKTLPPSQAKQLERLLQQENMPADQVILADGVSGSCFIQGISKSYLLYNHRIEYKNSEEGESIILHAIGIRDNRLVPIFHFVNHISYQWLRSLMAFFVGRSPSLMLAFGFNSDNIIGALAIGDFLMTSVRHCLVPWWMSAYRLGESKADKMVVSRGYREDFSSALLKSMNAIQYDWNQLYILTRSISQSTKRRIERLQET